MKKKVGAEQKTTALRDNYSFRAVDDYNVRTYLLNHLKNKKVEMP